jgi:hypothetical protein
MKKSHRSPAAKAALPPELTSGNLIDDAIPF